MSEPLARLTRAAHREAERQSAERGRKSLDWELVVRAVLYDLQVQGIITAHAVTEAGKSRDVQLGEVIQIGQKGPFTGALMAVDSIHAWGVMAYLIGPVLGADKGPQRIYQRFQWLEFRPLGAKYLVEEPGDGG